MPPDRILQRGALLGLFTGVGISVAAAAVHWFFTPAEHPDASALRQLLVVVQALIGAGVALWAQLRLRRDSAILRATKS